MKTIEANWPNTPNYIINMEARESNCRRQTSSSGGAVINANVGKRSGAGLSFEEVQQAALISRQRHVVFVARSCAPPSASASASRVRTLQGK